MSASGVRKVAVVAAGGAVYSIAVYLTYQYLRPAAPPPDAGCGCCHSSSSSQNILTSPSRKQQFEKIASCYDSRIRWDEAFMGILLLRRFLLRHAQGDVLEVGAGTARNLPYYHSDKVKRLVLTDSSVGMLQEAQRKIQQKKDHTTSTTTRIVTCQADAHQLPLPDRTFDTVVDTFGLCSYDDPVTVLKEMARVCKPNGTILLLEHGRSKTFPFVTSHLDRTAPQHAANWGCVWNRDLDAILQTSGVKIDKLVTWHFGTTYYVLCRPNLDKVA